MTVLNILAPAPFYSKYTLVEQIHKTKRSVHIGTTRNTLSYIHRTFDVVLNTLITYYGVYLIRYYEVVLVYYICMINWC